MKAPAHPQRTQLKGPAIVEHIRPRNNADSKRDPRGLQLAARSTIGNSLGQHSIESNRNHNVEKLLHAVNRLVGPRLDELMQKFRLPLWVLQLAHLQWQAPMRVGIDDILLDSIANSNLDIVTGHSLLVDVHNNKLIDHTEIIAAPEQVELVLCRVKFLFMIYNDSHQVSYLPNLRLEYIQDKPIQSTAQHYKLGLDYQ